MCKFYCKSLNINIVVTPFKIADIFKVKDPGPKSLKSFLVYKFVCPGCSACYIGETTRHLSTRIKEYLEADKKSHIFAHLANNETCKAFKTENCFEIIDSASTPFRLKLIEATHIIWKKPSLNKQQKHVSICITVHSSFMFNHYFHLPFHFILFALVYYFLFEHLIKFLDVF